MIRGEPKKGSGGGNGASTKCCSGVANLPHLRGLPTLASQGIDKNLAKRQPLISTSEANA
jgi:hypothetical protein